MPSGRQLSIRKPSLFLPPFTRNSPGLAKILQRHLPLLLHRYALFLGLTTYEQVKVA
jgi:hypothetical protein